MKTLKLCLQCMNYVTLVFHGMNLQFHSQIKKIELNDPDLLLQVLNALNGTDAVEDSEEDPDRVFRGSDTYCGSCQILSKMVIGYSRLGGPIDIMANFLVKICYIVGYRSIPVCRGIINQDKVRGMCVSECLCVIPICAHKEFYTQRAHSEPLMCVEQGLFNTLVPHIQYISQLHVFYIISWYRNIS